MEPLIVEIVNAVVPDLSDVSVTVAGLQLYDPLKLDVALAVNPTVPAYPPDEVTVTVEAPLPPSAATVTSVAETVIFG